MPSNTFNAFYLGTYADVDPTEGNDFSENSMDLVGQSFGSAGDPAWRNDTPLTLNDPDGDGRTYDNDWGAGETLTHAGTTSELDSSMLYNVTVTYTDGSTALTQVVVMQDTGGRVFIAPHIEGHWANAALTDGPVQSISLDSVADDSFSFTYTNLANLAFTCFAQGTLVGTPYGPRPIETLRCGDMVNTLDNGAQPLRWTARRRIGPLAVMANAALRPIKITRGALGDGIPARDLVVSPQHRILLSSHTAQRMFGTKQVLAPAKALLDLPGVAYAVNGRGVTYIHLLFDTHQILFSHGVASESLFMGASAASALGADRIAEIERLFAASNSGGQLPSKHPARPFVKVRQGKRLVARHQANEKPLVCSCCLPGLTSARAGHPALTVLA
tara:strand:- start:95518 stop:96678 length:1161 start_codon:yes stop_codon:yes gene_type:complete